MNGRQFNSSSYKYGFNGQEKDDEIFQGAMTAEFWEYDSRLGRRWNLDPVPQVNISDYACFGNNPILFTDPNGDVPTDKDGDKKAEKTKSSVSIIFYQNEGAIDNNFVKAAKSGGALLVKVNNIAGASSVIKGLSENYDISNVSFIAHGSENGPNMYFGKDKVNEASIENFKSSFTEIGANMSKNGTISMISCGMGRTNSSGDNKIIGNIAAWSGKSTFAAKGFVNLAMIGMGIANNHLPFSKESPSSFPTMYEHQGQFTVATPALKNSNYRYVIFNTGTIAFTLHGPRTVETTTSLDKIGKRVDSAFRANDDFRVQDRKYQRLNSSFKLFK